MMQGAPFMMIQPTGDKKGHYALYVTKLSQAIARLGRPVVIATNRINLDPYGGVAPGVEIVEIGNGRYAFDETIGGGPRYWLNYFRNSFLVTFGALQLAKRRGIRDIYISDCEFLMLSLCLFLVSDSKRRVLLHNNAANFSYRDYRGSRLKKLYKAFQANIFRLAVLHRLAGVNVLGEWHAARIRSQLRLPDSYPVLVIPDGADITDSAGDRTEARQRLGLPLEAPLFVVFGNFRRDKDYPLLFAALARVKHPALKIMLAGHPAEYSRAELEQMIAEAGVADRIALLRTEFVARGTVRDLFSAADALILPYGAEYVDGSGPLRNESATFSRAIIASDVAEMGSLVRGHELGRLYQAGDAVALAAVLDEMAFSSPAVRDQWGANCRRLGEGNSWDSMASKFDHFLDSRYAVLSK
jgi:glycosyltransferase involved in cell wall biosynthesis